MTSPAGTLGLPSPADKRPDLALWRRIERHKFDKPGTEFPFSKRLADENGWPHDYALRVVQEYRRFIYLVCISDKELTPSDEVDQVWHLHLAYSRDYWEEFCPKVLQRPLHHGPTEGGLAERRRYEDNYGRTLKLYHETFSEPPPPDVWPPGQIRFDPKARFVRVNRAYFAVTPKSSRRLPGFIDTAFLSLFWIVLGAVFLTSVGRQVLGRELHKTVTDMLPWVVICFFVIAIAYMAWTALRDASPPLPRMFADRQSQRRVSQPQHGYTVSFGVSVGVGAGVAAVASEASVSGDGSGEGGGGGSDGSGCGGGGGGGCGGCGG